MARTWLKIDDTMVENPKFVDLSPFAWTLWIHGVSYCSRNLTDGRIPQAMLPRLTSITDPSRAAAELVDAELWHAIDAGWALHQAPDTYELVRDRRPSMPRRLRDLILDRDHHRCAYCAATAALEVDHIQPWSKGGSFDDPNNLQILCRPCNATKGASWVG
jgi:hypothetical protein